MSVPDNPTDRVEMFLNAILTGDGSNLPEPESRVEEYLNAIYLQGGGGGGSSSIKKGTITLSTSWSGNGPYSQRVTITGATATENSRIDLQPTAAQLATLIDDGVQALTIENNNGTLTAWAVGAETSASMVIQCTITEVET